MPQLDKLTYFSQLFWLLLVLIIIYILLLRWVLPTVATVLKLRNKLVQHFVITGTALNQEIFSVDQKQNKVATALVSSLNVSLDQLKEEFKLQEQLQYINIRQGSEFEHINVLLTNKLISIYILNVLSENE